MLHLPPMRRLTTQSSDGITMFNLCFKECMTAWSGNCTITKSSARFDGYHCVWCAWVKNECVALFGNAWPAGQKWQLTITNGPWILIFTYDRPYALQRQPSAALAVLIGSHREISTPLWESLKEDFLKGFKYRVKKKGFLQDELRSCCRSSCQPLFS